MKLFLILSLLVFVKSAANRTASGVYTIVCENTLQAGTKFHIYVTIHNGTAPVELAAKLSSKMGKQHPREIRKSLALSPRKGILLEMDIPLNWTDGYYDLELDAAGGASFNHHKELFLANVIQRFVIKITMDKEIYSKGDMVRFTALIIDERGKAIPDGDYVNAFIHTKAGLLVKEWINATTHRGVFWNEFHLDEHCHKGEHVITVDYKGVTNTYRFYIPDRDANFVQNSLFYDVGVIAPKIINLNDTQITAIVRAVYKCGHFVNGSLNLKLYGKHCFTDQDCGPRTILQNEPIYGSTEVRIDMPPRLGIADWYLEATLTDELTGRVRTATKLLEIREFSDDFEIQLLHKYFNPGLQYRFHVAVSKELNEKLPALGEAVVQVQVKYLQENSNAIKSTSEEFYDVVLLPQSPRISLTVTPPVDTYAMAIRLHAEKNNTSARQFIRAAPYNAKDKALTILVEDTNVKVGSIVKAQILTTVNLPLLTYHVVSIRSYEIIESGTSVVTGKETHQISFPVTADAVTHFYFIVYGVTNDNVLVADSRVFITTLENSLEMEMNVSALSVEPGAVINFTIKATPSTHLFLKASDSTLDQLLERFYNPASWAFTFDPKWSYWKELESSELYTIQWQIGFANSSHKQSALFRVPRLTLFTNSILQNEVDQNQTYRNPPDNIPLGNDSIWKLKPRQNFSPVWLWKNLTVNSEGEITFSTFAPDQISTWYTSAYGVDDKHRIGFVKGPTVNVTKPLFALLDLPQNLIRGEAVQIRVFVFRENFEKVNVTLISRNQTFQILDEVSHRVLTNKSLTKTVSTDSLVQTITFIIAPLYTGKLKLEVHVISDNSSLEDTVIRQIDVNESPRDLKPVIYGSNDALRHGEVFCVGQLRKINAAAGASERLNISFQVNSMNDELGFLILNACIRYANANESDIILEAQLPTGYEFISNMDTNNSSITVFTHYEVSEGGSKVKWFFSKIPNDFICISAKAKRIFLVYNLQAAKVTAYTSMDLLKAKRAIVYYRAPSFDF